jgi:hypothetical protein
MNTRITVKNLTKSVDIYLPLDAWEREYLQALRKVLRAAWFSFEKTLELDFIKNAEKK